MILSPELQVRQCAAYGTYLYLDPARNAAAVILTQTTGANRSTNPHASTSNNSSPLNN